MSVTIQTNVAALNAQRHLQQTMMTLDSALSKLSSGFRITRAGDDAAGLGISENLRAQIRSLGQAQRNAFDGLSVLQTAEGALNEVSNILIRMRELSMQSASDGVSDTERGYLETEFDALVEEIDRIAQTTEFNNQKLLNGSLAASGLEFQVGIRNTANDRFQVLFSSATSTALSVNSTALSIAYKSSAQGALTVLDTAIQSVSNIRATLGAYGNRLNSTISNLAIAYENLSAANSRIRDVDVAEETSNLTRSQILMQAGISVLAQANAVPQVALTLLGG